MKYIIFLLIFGCAQFSVKYEYPDGTKVSGSYFRFGNQEFGNFHIRGDSGLEIELGYQKADTEVLKELLRQSNEILRRIP